VYYNGVLSHLKGEFGNHSAQVLDWTEEQKSRLEKITQPDQPTGVLKTILNAVGLGQGDTKDGAATQGGNAAVAGPVSFDSWPADIKTVVHREPIYHSLFARHCSYLLLRSRWVYFLPAKGDASAGYSSLSLAVLEAQSKISVDLDQVKDSDGPIASQSTSYGVYSVDIGYVAEIHVGTPSKGYLMMIDTGS
jgi:hypothetical protein